MNPEATTPRIATRVPPLAALEKAPITTTADGSLTPGELKAGSEAFAAAYQLANGGAVPGQVSILFQELQDKVALFLRSSKIAEDEVACRFIHRFDLAAKAWYPCLEFNKMVSLGTTDAFGRFEYALTPYPAMRFDLLNGITGSTLQGLYDPNYFNNLFFKDPAAPQPVAKPLTYGVDVQSVVLPWMREILRLCQQNNLENVPGARLVIQSIAMPPAHPGDTRTSLPHTIAMYMRDAQGLDRLGLRTDNKVFHNQAADVGTACPTNCSKYLMPADLPM